MPICLIQTILCLYFSQRIKAEKQLEIYLVLTPEYEGSPLDRSLAVYDEIAEVFFISEVNSETLITIVENFEEGNCLQAEQNVEISNHNNPYLIHGKTIDCDRNEKDYFMVALETDFILAY